MATTHYKGLTVVIDGNVTKLKKAMGELRAEGTVLRSHLTSLGKLIEFNPASTELLAQKQRMLGTALAQNAAQFQTLKAAEASYHAQTGPHTAAEEVEFRNLQRRLTQVQLEYQRLKQQAIQFGSAASLATLTARGRLQSMQQTLSTVSNKFMAVGAAAGIVGALSLKSAMSFEQAFADVRKTIIATEEEYAKLASEIREMALVKPISVENLAYIESLGGQLNVATQYLTKFTGVIADLDIATDMNLEDASLQLARFMNIAGMGQQDVDRLGATIVDLGNNSATTESQIMLMAMRIVGSASNIGMSAPNVLALATALSSVGIQAEMGGNAISTIMNRIDKDVALNNKTLSTWAATAGMSAQEFSTLWKNDVTSALMAVVKGMGTFRDEGNNLNLLLKDMGINYMRQIDTMQRMSRTGDLMADAFARSDTAWEQNIALTREASQRYETAESKMQMMKNAINEAGITIGNEILPYFKQLVVGVTDGIQAFAKMDEGTKQFIITAGGIVTIGALGVKGLELLCGTGAKVIGTFASMKTAMAFYIAEQTVGTGATAANTAATVANTAAEEVNVVARRANVAATAQEAATQNIVTVAKNAATIASGRLCAALGIESALALGLVGIVGVAAVAALVAFASAVVDAADDTDELTEASKRSEQSMKAAQVEYAKTVIEQGENSNAALAAKAALDEETAAFEASKETVSQFCERMRDTVELHEDLMDTVSSATAEANDQAGSLLHLANQYDQLSNAESRDEQQKQKLAAISAALGQSIEGLEGAYDSETDSVNMTADAVMALAEKEAQRIQAAAEMDNLTELYAAQNTIMSDLAEAQAELEAETKANVDAFGMLGDVQVFTSAAQTELQGTVDDLTEAYEKNQAEIEKRSQQLAAMQSRELALKYATDALAAGTLNAADAAATMNERFGTSITEADVLAEREARLAENARQVAIDVSDVVAKLEKLEEENSALVIAIAESGLSIEEFAQKMVEAGIKADDLAKGVQEAADKTSDAFNKIEYQSDLSLDSMIETLEHNIEVTEAWGDNMAKLYEKAGDDITKRNFVQHVAQLGVEYAPIVEQLLNDTEGRLDKLAHLYAQAGTEGPIAFLQGIGMLPAETSAITDEMVDEATDGFNRLVEAAREAGAQTPEAIAAVIRESGAPEEAINELTDAIMAELGLLPEQAGETTEPTGSEMADGIMAQSDAVAAAADTMSKLAADHFSSASTDAWFAGEAMAGRHFRDGLNSGQNDAVAAADTISKLVADHFSSANGDAWWAGNNMAAGMRDGILAGQDMIVAAARQVAQAANAAAKAATEQNSPSKVWMRIGHGLPEGGALGILNAMDLMVKAAEYAVKKTSAAAEREWNASAALAPGLRAIDNADSVPQGIMAMLSNPYSAYERRYGSLSQEAVHGTEASGGTSIYNDWSIYSNNPEEVAALVEARQRRAMY